MISGIVNARLEAIIQLTVQGAGPSQRQVDALVDTGFSGHLTLPAAEIQALQLTWLGREQGVLADGSIDLFEVYRAWVVWDGQVRSVEVNEANTQPLVGMALLEYHTLLVNVVAGKDVVIKPYPGTSTSLP